MKRLTVDIPRGECLMRTVLRNRELFYGQSWYEDEDFAYADTSGNWDLTDTYLVPVGVWAYASAHTVWEHERLLGMYVWTSSKDQMGDQVYIGKSQLRGVQIHRHLMVHDEEFINPGGKDRK